MLQVAALALVAVSFFKVAQHLRDPLPAALDAQESAADTSTPENHDFLLYAKAMNDAQEAFVVAVKDKNPSNIDAAAKGLDEAPRLDQQADELKNKLKALAAASQRATSRA